MIERRSNIERLCFGHSDFVIPSSLDIRPSSFCAKWIAERKDGSASPEDDGSRRRSRMTLKHAPRSEELGGDSHIYFFNALSCLREGYGGPGDNAFDPGAF